MACRDLLDPPFFPEARLSPLLASVQLVEMALSFTIESEAAGSITQLAYRRLRYR